MWRRPVGTRYARLSVRQRCHPLRAAQQLPFHARDHIDARRKLEGDKLKLADQRPLGFSGFDARVPKCVVEPVDHLNQLMRCGFGVVFTEQMACTIVNLLNRLIASTTFDDAFAKTVNAVLSGSLGRC